MYRIKIMAAVLLFSGLFSACGKKDYNAGEENIMPHYVYTTTPTETKVYVGELLEDGKSEESYEFTVRYGIPDGKTSGIAANIEIDNSLIEAYGKATSQSLQSLPAEFISFSGGTVNIPAGTREAKVTFKLVNIDRIPTGLYCVPVTIKPAGTDAGFSIHETKRTAYYVVTKGISVLKEVTGMKFVSTSDEEVNDEPGNAEHVVDGDKGTYWHSHYANDDYSPFPHWVIIDLGKTTEIARIEMVRLFGVKDFEYLINASSSDPNDTGWTSIATGMYANDGTPHEFTSDIAALKPARYLKVVVTSTYRGWPPNLIGIRNIYVYRWGY